MSATSNQRSDRPAGQSGRPNKRELARQKAAEQERQRRRNRLLTGLFAIILVAVVAVVAAPRIINAGGDPDPVAPAAGDITVRENSHRLTEVPDGKVTFVEFLDFECEACGSVYPTIEQLRQQYGDRVTFVVRYFPLDGHFNGERAARAVEAAAQQGQFEAMYKKMFDTQTEWGEQQVPQDELFRSYAEELGLDVAQWENDYDSAETKARIQADIADGKKLGVQSTPTFFLNGEKLEPQSVTDITDAFDQALAR